VGMNKATFLKRPNRFTLICILKGKVVKAYLPNPGRMWELLLLGEIRFPKGYYLYVGSARRNLSSRIERHRRMRKKLFWHVDFLRAMAEFHTAVPIRTQDVLECKIAQAVKKIAEWEIPGFGSSDCFCSSHLYGMVKDPLQSARFISLLQYYRMDRLIAVIEECR